MLEIISLIIIISLVVAFARIIFPIVFWIGLISFVIGILSFLF